MRPRCLALLFLLVLFALPAAAEGPPPTAFRKNILYLGQGQILTVMPSRQLTLNAHVSQFRYEPLGVEVAYAGWERTGNAINYFVRVMDTRSGNIMSRLSQTVTAPPQSEDGDAISQRGYRMLGWSNNGNILLLRKPQPEAEFEMLDVGADPPAVRPLPLEPALPAGATAYVGGNYAWSPQHRRIVFEMSPIQQIDPNTPAPPPLATRPAYAVYDPASNRTTPVAVPPGQQIVGWQGEDNLLAANYGEAGGNAAFFRVSLRTGEETGISPVANAPFLENIQSPDQSSAAGVVSPTDPSLSLDIEAPHIVDARKAADIEAHSLWIRRKANKLLSTVPVGLTPGEDEPQAQWSPTGKQILYIAHGDLFVTDIKTDSATSLEKLAAGEKLPCSEEQQLVQTSLQQIGLALIQYAQDSDNTLPSGQDITERLLPYLHDGRLFQLGGNQFVYRGSDTTFSKIQNPSQTVLGTYDTPCARNVLYADGHVKSFPKPGVSPAKD